MNRKSSPLWEHFTINSTDQSKVTCNQCGQSVSRGGNSQVSFNTTNLLTHLRRHHSAILKQVQDAQAQQKAACSSTATVGACSVKQPTVTQSFERAKVWDINDTRAVRVNRLVAEFIASDDMPFQLASSAAFARLLHSLEPRYKLPSEKYFRTSLIPEIYEAMVTKVANSMSLESGVQFMSFTTDAWTTPQCTESILSLTGHWIDADFNRHSAMLGASQVVGQHTAANIAELLQKMIDKWSLQDRIHVLLRDNAASMIKAMDDSHFPSFGCVSHTLQLCINKALKVLRAVEDIVSNCRRIAAHFSKSTLAKHKLQKLQKSQQLPQHSIIQDITTRWNSTFYMMERIKEQKMALVTYAADNDIPTLTQHQWSLVDKVVALLDPFEQVTKQLCNDDSTLADVIPTVTALRMTLSSMHDASGVDSMKDELLSEIKRRFENIEKEHLLVVATLVDPRYKDRLLSAENKVRAAEALTHEVQQLEQRQQAIQEISNQIQISTPQTEQEEPGTSSKRMRMSPLDCLDAILRPASGIPVVDGNSAANQVQLYLSADVIPLDSDPLQWWKTNGHHFPSLPAVARRFLSAPSTSVASERLFSAAGNIYTDKRHSLLPDKAEKLLFIKRNLVHCDFD